jgi:hypothetical protein
VRRARRLLGDSSPRSRGRCRGPKLFERQVDVRHRPTPEGRGGGTAIESAVPLRPFRAAFPNRVHPRQGRSLEGHGPGCSPAPARRGEATPLQFRPRERTSPRSQLRDSRGQALLGGQGASFCEDLRVGLRSCLEETASRRFPGARATPSRTPERSREAEAAPLPEPLAGLRPRPPRGWGDGSGSSR